MSRSVAEAKVLAQSIWPFVKAGLSASMIAERKNISTYSAERAASRALCMAFETECTREQMAMALFQGTTKRESDFNKYVLASKNVRDRAASLGVPASAFSAPMMREVIRRYAGVYWELLKDAQRKATDWAYPLDEYVVHLLERAGFKSKDAVRDALQSGALYRRRRVKTDNPRELSPDELRVLCDWVGISADECTLDSQRQRELDLRLQAAIELLQQHGYHVTPPKAA